MNIIIAGCGKNIDYNINILKENLKNFKINKNINKCKFIICENNSIDNTVNLLKEWEKEDNDVKCIINNYTDNELLNMSKARTYDNLPCRMEIIAICRNKILNEIANNEYNDFEYVIMFDLDINKLLPFDNIINILNNKKYEFDALICKGTNNQNEIYDTFAYKDEKYYMGKEHGNMNYINEMEKKIKNYIKNNNDELIPVLSGFNGMCIIKKNSIGNCKYSAIPNKALDNFYRTKEFKINNNTHWEGRLLGIYLHGKDGIFYHNCCGYNFPIVCEHVNFFMSMRENGNNKIYLCNKLVWENIWN